MILAGIFAAAISSLDSILAALSQTTISLFRKTDVDASEEVNRNNVLLSRITVVVWGVALSLFAVALHKLRGDVNVVQLAFGMTSYTVGPMLAFFLLPTLHLMPA